jgi:arabinofuranosyltransferase
MYGDHEIPNPQSKLLIIGSGFAFLLLAVISMMTIGAAEDDAFIVYRYVDRFLEHKGLTYNDGESVEGFTSLLWTVLLAGGSIIGGVKPYVASVWMNYTFILLTALSMIWLMQIWRVGSVLKLISLFLFSISTLYFKVVFLGLEFGFFTLLLFLFLCFFLRGLDYSNYRTPDKLLSCVSGFLAAALFATRPESIIELPVLSLLAYVFQRQNRNIRTSLVYSACSFVSFLILILAWRLIYYGELLRNSVITKSISLGSLFAKTAPFSRKDLLRDGITYLVDAYATNPAFLFTVFVVGIVIWQKWRTFELSLLLTPILWQHVIIIENGGDWMDYSRFITMFAPLFIVVFSLAIDVSLPRYKTIGVISLFVFSILYLFANVPYLTLTERSASGFSPNETDSYQSIGQAVLGRLQLLSLSNSPWNSTSSLHP